MLLDQTGVEKGSRPGIGGPEPVEQRRVSGDRFFTIVYTLLILVGCKLLWDGAAAFFG